MHQRRERTEIDQDEAAEGVVQRRISEAEARNRPLSAADHQQFDARIRATPEAKASPRTLRAASLRQAIIWKEILGPPKAFEE